VTNELCMWLGFPAKEHSRLVEIALVGSATRKKRLVGEYCCFRLYGENCSSCSCLAGLQRNPEGKGAGCCCPCRSVDLLRRHSLFSAINDE
jgi:hypothetical protein